MLSPLPMMLKHTITWSRYLVNEWKCWRGCGGTLELLSLSERYVILFRDFIVYCDNVIITGWDVSRYQICYLMSGKQNIRRYHQTMTLTLILTLT